MTVRRRLFVQYETNKDKEPLIALTRKRFTKQRKLKEDNEFARIKIRDWKDAECLA